MFYKMSMRHAIIIVLSISWVAFTNSMQDQPSPTKFVINIANKNHQGNAPSTEHHPFHLHVPNFLHPHHAPLPIPTPPSSGSPSTHGIAINNSNHQQANFWHGIGHHAPEHCKPLPVTPQTTSWSTFFTACLNHKKILALATLTTLYSFMWGSLWYQNYLITNKSIWGTWQVDPFTVEQLYNAMVVYYAQEAPRYGFLTPIVRFLQDNNQELARIDRYLTWNSWLQKFYLSYLLPNQEKSIEQARFTHQRLTFYREALLAWLRDAPQLSAAPHGA
jgi:hypothetical protein